MAVAVGTNHTLALKTSGTLWAWGANDYGQLGDGTNYSSTLPIQVNPETDWISISCGSHHSMAGKSDGSLWAWGNNDEGQLGIETEDTTELTPVIVGY